MKGGSRKAGGEGKRKRNGLREEGKREEQDDEGMRAREEGQRGMGM